MSRIAYVNGRYAPHGQAAVHIEDRGFQFADGVYEVWSVFGGRLADADGHFERLTRSLTALRIDIPMTRAALERVLRETLRRNRVRDGLVYLQITRGAARRDHAFPNAGTPTTVVVTARAVDVAAAEAKAAKGVAVVTQPDQRWGRCDIKTVSLLPNVLAKQAAREAGAYEAWLVDADGLVTEGASTNAWIVDAAGILRTRDTAANILRGVTRKALLQIASELQMAVEERPFTVAEAQAAREAFITAASAFVTPVVTIDGRQVSDGQVGPVAKRLRALYLDVATRTAI
jgi:D-alanine transaminase